MSSEDKCYGCYLQGGSPWCPQGGALDGSSESKTIMKQEVHEMGTVPPCHPDIITSSASELSATCRNEPRIKQEVRTFDENGNLTDQSFQGFLIDLPKQEISGLEVLFNGPVIISLSIEIFSETNMMENAPHLEANPQIAISESAVQGESCVSELGTLPLCHPDKRSSIASESNSTPHDEPPTKQEMPTANKNIDMPRQEILGLERAFTGPVISLVMEILSETNIKENAPSLEADPQIAISETAVQGESSESKVIIRQEDNDMGTLPLCHPDKRSSAASELNVTLHDEPPIKQEVPNFPENKNMMDQFFRGFQIDLPKQEFSGIEGMLMGPVTSIAMEFFSEIKVKKSRKENAKEMVDHEQPQKAQLPPEKHEPQPRQTAAAPPPAKTKTEEQIPNKSTSSQSFTFRELASATKNFRPECLLGEGRFGRVYKGSLEKTGQVVVAVKQLDRHGGLGNQEFLVEVLMLSLLHHENLVDLVGYCADGDQRLLVHEYITGGRLEDHLFDIQPDQKSLDWYTRMKIATGTARGLEYLHDKANPPVLYRDFKVSNIILDEEFNPKLSDFGLAKLSASGENKFNVSSRVMGTCAPECITSGELTSKSDVYSFGVVLLELITGRRAVDTTKPNEEQNLVAWAQALFRDPKRFPAMADPLLQKQFPETGLNQVMGIAAMCLQEEPHARPLIGDVVAAFSFLSVPSNEGIPAPLSFPSMKGKDDHESQVMEYGSYGHDDGKASHEDAESEEESSQIVPESKEWAGSQKSISFSNQKIWDTSSGEGSMEHGWDNSNRYANSETHRFLDSDSSVGKSSRKDESSDWRRRGSGNGSFSSNESGDNNMSRGGSEDDVSASSSPPHRRGKRAYSIRKLGKKFSRKSSTSSRGSGMRM